MREQLLHECVAMARYALASGMPVPASVADAIEKARFADSGEPLNMAPVVKAHDHLSRLVAPATPRALLALGEEHSTSRIAWLGSVGLVRRMLGAAVFSVLLFMALSALPQTTIGNVKDWQTGDGWGVLVNDLFLMAAAGIGASFAMLMQVNGYIVKRTYDPKYEPTYWIKFILGVMAGFILAALLPSSSPDSGSSALTLPVLSMLGGFSASAVYRILAKMVESVEAVFRGSPAEEMAQRERAAQTRASEEVSQARLRVAAQIVSLQQQVSAGADPATLTQALSGVLNSLAPTGEQPAPPAAEQPAPAAPAPAPTTVSLPNIPIVAAPEQVAPPAVTDPPAPPPTAVDASAADDAPEEAAAPAAAYVGGDSDEDMSGGDESGEAGPSTAAPVQDTGEDDGSQSGAVG